LKKYTDPYQQREAKKYARPIPSRELMLEVLTNSSKPMGFRDLADELGLSEREDLDPMKYRLRAMERDGQIIYNRRREYIPIQKSDLISGRISGHPDGFGFLIPDDGSEDLFLHGKQMRKVMHGDKVLAMIKGVDRRGRKEGAIAEVVERNTEQLVGRYFGGEGSGVGFVRPDNSRITHDIVIPAENNHNASDGQIVVAAIVEQPTVHHQAIGKIVEILGDHMAPGMEIDIALRSYDLPHTWSSEVSAEANKLGEEVTEKDKKERYDFRAVPLVTIDGADSHDFDDAVFCQREGDNWRLVVAIADVSHYVPIGSKLDKEAWNRSTSVYFPAEVIPMLPETISNGLCSLNPDVDRLCMVCSTLINSQGEIMEYEFLEGVMHSFARLTYNKMAAIVVDNDQDLRNKYSNIVHHLDDLYSLYHVLRKARDQRGAMDFETTETQIIFAKDRKIKNILPTERNDAHKIIEECMIVANVCSARFLKEHKIPALHRVHEGPDQEGIEKVHEFLKGLGLNLSGGDKPQPKDYANLLASVIDRPDAHLIQTVLLRSLSRAFYAPVNPEKAESTWHFGLAQKDYAHFTSPIRRYPDLLVHRAIRHIIQGNSVKSYAYNFTDMKALGEHCSTNERRADDASRDVMAWLKAEYMLDKVGETFTGVISAVTGFGLFVELNEVYVEGLVHVTALKSDYYHFDATRHRITGENSGKTYNLGDPIEVVVARVDLDERKIDFTLPETTDIESRKPRKKSKKKISKKAKKENNFV
jgi:ribonuclease R